MDKEKQPGNLTDPQASARTLFRMAWGVEFVAAGTGLLIALVMLLSATGQNGTANSQSSAQLWAVGLVAALPFALIALAELTKIPLASAFYHTRRGPWKILFLVGLLVLAGVTFETMLTGLETNFSTRTHVVNGKQSELAGSKEELAELRRQIAELESLTEEEVRTRSDAASTGASSAFAQALSELRAEREKKRAEIYRDLETVTQRRSAVTRRMNARDTRHAEDRTRLEQARQREFARLAGTSGDQRVSIGEELEDIRESIASLDAREAQELEGRPLGGILGGRGRIEDKYQARRRGLTARRSALEIKLDRTGSTASSSPELRRLQGQLGQLERLYHRERGELLEDLNTLEHESAPIRQELDGTWVTWKQDFERREQELLSERSTRLTEIGADLRRGLEELRVRGSRLVALRDDLHRVTERKLGLRRELEQVAAASQIHRFARLLSGAESAADVSREDVRTVSVIWFGSLAAIVAWTGTLLALAANVVANGGTTPDSGQSTGTRNSRGRTLRSLRRFFVAERRRRGRVLVKTETKEIVKEVPVERVIVKEVEVQKVVKQEVPIEKLVPIETRVRDIKYVPVPVNDPEGLQRGLDTTNARLEDHTESNVTRLSSQAGGATHS